MTEKKGVYLLAGGNWNKPHALSPLLLSVKMASGSSNPKVAYIGVANSDDESFFNMFKQSMEVIGIKELVLVHLSSEQANVSKAKEELIHSDIIFVSGGDVFEGMKWLNKHQLVPFLLELYQGGKLFFGLSAGSIMLGKKWVDWKNPDDNETAELFDCIGIAPISCDTHAEKEHWEELKVAVKLMGEGSAGFGIPSGAALIVEPDGRLRALAKRTVGFEFQDGEVKDIIDNRIIFETSSW